MLYCIVLYCIVLYSVTVLFGHLGGAEHPSSCPPGRHAGQLPANTPIYCDTLQPPQTLNYFQKQQLKVKEALPSRQKLTPKKWSILMNLPIYFTQEKVSSPNMIIWYLRIS